MATPRTILFAGGGTGGHIFPNLAVVERLAEHQAPLRPCFVVSGRAVDAQILTQRSMTYLPIPAQPFTSHPWQWPAFFRAWQASVAMVKRLIAEQQAAALIATGGFVSAPAISAAAAAGIPVLLVNLDAVPGRANRLMARRASEVLSAYPCPLLRATQTIGVPLLRSAVGGKDQGLARQQLGLDPQRDMLLITGGSQGAQSINRLMLELLARAEPRKALGRSWQVMHLSGGGPEEAQALREAYQQAQVPARVESFCNQMGLAWSAASIAICRAGANTVAEAWANATPSIFLPYPYHKDQHQRLNAEPLVRMGAALLLVDLIDPRRNATQTSGPLLALMANSQQRLHMVQRMEQRRPADGAEVLAQRVLRILAGHNSAPLEATP